MIEGFLKHQHLLRLHWTWFCVMTCYTTVKSQATHQQCALASLTNSVPNLAVQELYRHRVLERRYMEGQVIKPLLDRAVQQYEELVQRRCCLCNILSHTLSSLVGNSIQDLSREESVGQITDQLS